MKVLFYGPIHRFLCSKRKNFVPPPLTDTFYMPTPVPHPLHQLLEGRRIVLGSQSPRRVQLLRDLGLDFEVRPSGADESHPTHISSEHIPLELAKRKATALMPIASDEILLTADTVVLLDDQLIEKPHDLQEARQFLHRLSDHWHTVITGYTLTHGSQQVTGEVRSDIHFAPLDDREIDYYIGHYQVLDKAGAYGIQDWIGLIGVSEVRGSYNNVIGLPTTHIYHALKNLLHY